MNILIPYNFSESAIKALNFTKLLFYNKPIKVILMDVYISRKPSLLSSEQNKKWFDEIEDELKEELKYLIEILNREESTFIYEFKVDSNALITSINETIDEKKIDLVISGTYGVNNFYDSLKGTNTMRIIENIKQCPIIVVPEQYKIRKLNQLIFSTNFKRSFLKKELKFLTFLSIINDLPIEVLDVSRVEHLDNNQLTNKSNLEIILEDVDFSNKKLNSSNLINYLEKYTGGLSVFTRYKLNFLDRLLKEDFIKEMTFHGKIPILVLPDYSK